MVSPRKLSLGSGSILPCYVLYRSHFLIASLHLGGALVFARPAGGTLAICYLSSKACFVPHVIGLCLRLWRKRTAVGLILRCPRARHSVDRISPAVRRWPRSRRNLRICASLQVAEVRPPGIGDRFRLRHQPQSRLQVQAQSLLQSLCYMHRCPGNCKVGHRYRSAHSSPR
ncbi:hypothetical protein M407DRAFT_89365 [Tulasnella calospora MUT 4182]|uniref:Uncharacterized protein n=1 Tax=Tulasnella calospora MUT 4182 TaxID=1051891 RepID=A0A0C3QXB5_9AGAM|nr:hypothetical protein M407DRAFT_89365 [Tulasnella calospora MUT 4182]